jgi:hypothetical protein
MKVQKSPKYHFIITSSQILKKKKKHGKLNEHTISQSGKKPIIEFFLQEICKKKASASLYFTCTSSHNHCSKNSKYSRNISCVKKKMINNVKIHDQLKDVEGSAFNQ